MFLFLCFRAKYPLVLLLLLQKKNVTRECDYLGMWDVPFSRIRVCYNDLVRNRRIGRIYNLYLTSREQ